jgi:hypothetical protein
MLNESAEVGVVMLRTLGVIHLASALSLREELTAFVAYDHRLYEAAEAAGLQPVSPKP